MARNGSGQYTAPTSSFNPAINGVLATAGDWNALLADISAALTQSVSRDGQSPMLGNLPMGNNKVTGLAPGTGTGEALAFQQLFSQGTMADIASAATVDIGVQNTSFLRVTGTTTITSFGTNYRGPRFLTFAGAVTLTNSSTLVLPGNANITTAAGDSLIVIPGATLGTADKWIVVAYQSGVPLSTANVYTKTETDTALALKLNATNPSYTGTLTGGTGVINIGSGQLYKDASGNVGLGTSSPVSGAKLTMSGNAAAGTRPALGLENTFASSGRTYRIASTDDGAFNVRDETANAERMRIDANGNLLFNSGYGSAAVAYGCRAWVNFNGTGTVAIRASGNVSSITDNGTGDYTVNFATAMPDANYSAFAMNNATSGEYSTGIRSLTTTSIRTQNFKGGTGAADASVTVVGVIR